MSFLSDMGEDETHFVDLFIEGLRPGIGSVVRRCNPKSLWSAYCLAKWEESKETVDNNNDSAVSLMKFLNSDEKLIEVKNGIVEDVVVETIKESVEVEVENEVIDDEHDTDQGGNFQVLLKMTGRRSSPPKAVSFAARATGITTDPANSRFEIEKDFVNGFRELKSIRFDIMKDTGPSYLTTSVGPYPQHHQRTYDLPLLGYSHRNPKFEGRLCPDNFLDWLRTVDRIFDLRDTPDHIKVKLVAIRLKKSASLWWDHVQNQRYRKGKHRQDEAAHGKKVLARDSQARFIYGKTTTHFGSSSRAPQSATGPVRVGPIKSNPPALTGVSPTPTTSSLRCFKCQGICHLKRDCPNKQVLTLIDEAGPLYDTKDEVETEVVYPDRGELLVTLRLLNIIVLDQDDDTTWLRTNIFRTQCTAKGKVCTVIIDGGSCENMVSTTMVEKLGLPIQNHPDPYQLTWLKKGNLIKVTHRCLVHFSIGNKYTDELWCEVISMDACHILLGRLILDV
ncbi:reverse transcriptase domain-containing protein [Tanacetum coccineum]